MTQPHILVSQFAHKNRNDFRLQLHDAAIAAKRDMSEQRAVEVAGAIVDIKDVIYDWCIEFCDYSDLAQRQKLELLDLCNKQINLKDIKCEVIDYMDEDAEGEGDARLKDLWYLADDLFREITETAMKELKGEI